MHPLPSPAWANFTLMVEGTPESSRCYSVYSMDSTAPPRKYLQFCSHYVDDQYHKILTHPRDAAPLHTGAYCQAVTANRVQSVSNFLKFTLVAFL